MRLTQRTKTKKSNAFTALMHMERLSERLRSTSLRRIMWEVLLTELIMTMRAQLVTFSNLWSMKTTLIKTKRSTLITRLSSSFARWLSSKRVKKEMRKSQLTWQTRSRRFKPKSIPRRQSAKTWTSTRSWGKRRSVWETLRFMSCNASTTSWKRTWKIRKGQMKTSSRTTSRHSLRILSD